MVGQILVPLLCLICLLPYVNAAMALMLGVAVALSLGNPYIATTKAWTSRLLSYAVIGLGAGMNLLVVARVGLAGIGYTVVSIVSALGLGIVFGRYLKIEKNISLLISVGTAICGGSAIAAVAPVLRAKSHEVSVALAIVFLLNAAALFIFPPLGHALAFSQDQFGLWSALAIHDTSSVVGASLQYGPRALEVGTTIKLARALWIVPITFGIGWLTSRNVKPTSELGPTGPAKKPWFILGFLLMAALVTWVPSLQASGRWVEFAAKRLLVLTLFLIGAGLTRETLKAVGFRPFVQGFVLWLIIGSVTGLLIHFGWIGQA